MSTQPDGIEWCPLPSGMLAVIRYDPSRKERYFFIERALAVCVRGTGQYHCQGGYDTQTLPPADVLVLERGAGGRIDLYLRVYRSYEGILEPKEPSRLSRVQCFVQEADVATMTLEDWQNALDMNSAHGAEVRLLNGGCVKWDAQKRTGRKRRADDATG